MNFDPIELSRRTEQVVCRGNKRRYLRFGTTPDYRTGVATGYTAGCNLRCIFCAASETRENTDLARGFYSPEEVFEILYGIIQKHRKIKIARISDGEPTIGRDHLLQLIELFERSDVRNFFLETNGIILGNDESYIKELSGFKKLIVRVSIKAGTPESFTRMTKAIPEAFHLQFQAIRNLRKHGVELWISSMTADPRIMDPIERISLITRLGEIDPELVLKLEEEMTILFPTARNRLNGMCWQNGNSRLPFYLRGPLGKYVQVSYEPLKSLQKKRISLKHTLKNIIQLKHGI